MSLNPVNLSTTTPYRPVQPVQKVKPNATEKTPEEEAKELELKRQSLQEQRLLLKGTASTDAPASPELEKALDAQLEEVTRKLQAMEPQNTSSSKLAMARRFDRYEPGDAKPDSSAGLYHMEADDSGTPSVVFEPPSDEKASPSGAGKPDKNESRTTVNTDQVDAEIRRLKEKQEQTQQELRAAAGDEDREAQLKERLAQLDSELSLKNNDAYRKQHASVTTE